jgi:hypothetical protein
MKGAVNMTDPLDIDSDGMLDATPLKFGQYKGKLPEDVAEISARARQYLVWAYENVGNFDVCSAALYKDCGGKGKRAIPEDGKRNHRKDAMKVAHIASYGKDAAANQGAPRKTFFDDMDDDIPF